MYNTGLCYGKCFGWILLLFFVVLACGIQPVLIPFCCYPVVILLCGIQREMFYQGDEKVKRVVKNGIARWRNLLFFLILLSCATLLFWKIPLLLLTLPVVLPFTMLLLSGISFSTPETSFSSLLQTSVKALGKSFINSIVIVVLILGCLTILMGVASITNQPITQQGHHGRPGSQARAAAAGIILGTLMFRFCSFFFCSFGCVYCNALDIYPKYLLDETANNTPILSNNITQRFCAKCGKEILDGANFCTGCGQRIDNKDGK